MLFLCFQHPRLCFLLSLCLPYKWDLPISALAGHRPEGSQVIPLRALWAGAEVHAFAALGDRVGHSRHWHSIRVPHWGCTEDSAHTRPVAHCCC